MKSEKQDLERKNEKDPIAVVGIGCRFPGDVHGPDEFWQGLKNGMDAITNVPDNRWKNEAFYDPDPNKAGKIKTKKGGFLKEIDKFDADFFGIYPKIAERIDPQQRLLLEVTYEAFEDAGLKLEALSGSRTAVYVGVFTNDYWDIQTASEQKDDLSPHVAMGVILTAIANRLSYTFNLKGPSVTIDTACSSSLVGVHLACQSIWSGESTQAIAGGVNMILRPETSIMMSKGNFLSPDGYCKSFDSRANGYVRSEGCGIVVLKPLSKAIEDGDQIYGTILNTEVNQDGFTESGFTVPSLDAQTCMLEAAYANAGIDPGNVAYIEAHGTGTPVGDPIETNAFGNVIGKNRKKGNECIIGSVKTNVGHLEAAAGVAGLIKLSLILKNKQIPKNLHFLNPNPKIPFEDYKLKVATELQPLHENGQPAVCGVNSFGAGGTNAHVVMQGYRSNQQNDGISPSKKSDNAYLFTLTARSAEALKDLASNYVSFVKNASACLEDICYSVVNRRSSHQYRLAMAVKSKEQLVENLNAFMADEVRPGMHSNVLNNAVTHKIGFIFSGQGPQWFAMGQELIKSSPVFNKTITKIDHLFSKIADWSLLEEMNKNEKESRVGETNIAQPAIMAIQIGLAELWKSRGIIPHGCVGHSIGEVAAAFTSGSLTLEQAVEVIYHRSRGQNKASNKGKMLAVGLPYQQAKKVINGYDATVSVAAINGPNIVTLSGDTDPLESIAKTLDESDIFHKFLRVNVPFHSHHMAPLKDELIASLQHLEPIMAEISLYSTVTGKKEDGLHLVSEYWYKNVREPVFFTDALQAMIDDGFNTFIEIAPHPVLTTGAMEVLKENKMENALIVPSLRRLEDEEIISMGSLASLFTNGLTFDGIKLFDKNASYVKLPKYAWQRQSYWFENNNNKKTRLGTEIHPHIKSQTHSASDENRVIFELDLDKSVHPYIEEHKVDGTIIFPGTGHLEIATAIAKNIYRNDFFLEDVHFESALFLPDEENTPEIRFEIFSEEGGYGIYSKNDGGQWAKHSRGTINQSGDRFFSQPVNLRQVQEKVNEPLSVSDFYLELKEKGLQYGESFRLLKHLWQGPNSLLGLLELSDNQKYGVEKYNFHPTLLDACIHLVEYAGKWTNDEQNGGIYLPTYISRFKIHHKPENTVWCYTNIIEVNENKINADFWVISESGEVVAEIQGFEFKYIEGSRGESKNELYQGMYEYKWEKQADYMANLPAHKTETCVIFADHSGLGEKLAGLYTGNGSQAFVIYKGDSYSNTQNNFFEVIPNSQGHIEQVLRAIQIQGDIDKIIYMWSLDETQKDDIGADQLQNQQADLSLSMLNTMRAITGVGLEIPIYSLTQGLEHINKDDEINFNQATVLGISRVMMNEFSHINTRIIDISKEVSKVEINSLYSLLTSTDLQNIPEIALRSDTIYFQKLHRVTEESANQSVVKKHNAAGSGFQMLMPDPNDKDKIVFLRSDNGDLASNEVEIDVNCTKINQSSLNKFLMNEEVSLKSEHAGVVTAIGSGVEYLKAGDNVITLSSHPLSGKTIANANHTILKPQHLTFEEAIASSTAFLAAYFSMDQLVKIKKGAFVLIHDATSSAGLAALQLAELKGTQVIASADSDEKCGYLKLIGIKHVINHRNPGFADYIKKVTPQNGVDIILSTSTGKGLAQTVKCLLPYGSLIELSHEGQDREKMQINQLGSNCSYFSVNINNLIEEKPELCRELLNEIFSLLASRKIHSLSYESFSITNLKVALAQLKQPSKDDQVVIELREKNINILPPKTLSLDSDATYLITGGASGFGLWLGKWLVKKGAKHLVLVSRSGCKTDEDREMVARMERLGVEINLVNIDITNSQEVNMVLSMISETMPPLRGIIHSAAVLEDATLANMDQQRFLKVFNPKVLGAWNFHQGSKDNKLDFFLMLSSISSMFGLPGQANYSSANNFLDKLAHYRQSRGLAASSVNLGVLGNYAGMSKEGGNVLNVLANQGWLPLSFRQVSDKIENILLQKPAQRMAANLDWRRFKDFFTHFNQDFRYEEFIKEAQFNTNKEKQSGSTLIDEIMSSSPEGKSIILQEKIADSLARILGTTSDKIDQDVPISSIGLDSLMLNQLRNWIHQKLEINYPLMRIAKGPSIKELAFQLLKELAPDDNEGHLNKDDISGISNDPDIEMLAGKWLVRNKKNNKPVNRRIFCFHPVGAGASMFTHFLYNQPKDTDVLAIQLPGRENRIDETPYVDMSLLIKDLAKVIKPFTDKPFIIMGHSFGGIVGFELIKYLRNNFNISPEHFFITGTIAPQLTRDWKKRDSIDQTSKVSNSIEKILNTLNYIEDVEFLRSIIPVMKNDMPLIMNYPYVTDEPFDFPITGFAADKDEVVLIPEVKSWQEQTNSEFNLEIVKGDHWFLGRNRDLVLQRLTEALDKVTINKDHRSESIRQI